MPAVPDLGLDWVLTHPWAYPALEIVHIAGIALLFGNLALFELRIWGLGTSLPAEPLARLALPLALTGFAMAAASGLAMFAAQPLELLTNPAFGVKMGLLMVAGTNAAVFHARGSVRRLDRVARAQGLLSIVLWIAVIATGRLIAYL
ncbi:MAG TPA: hypothetical protein VM491_06510 [Burkholderiaceae bacterium]|jgi:hypothetical protein|nr:hypothetical protein [Burkholderiaceae bacterium]